MSATPTASHRPASSVSLQSFGARLHACPICAGLSFDGLARHDRNLLGVVTVGCRTCGLVQTNPRPTAEGLTVFYRDHYRQFYQRTETPDAAYIATLAKDVRLAYTTDFFARTLQVPKDAVILDYGCGEGSLFAALRKAAFEGRFYGVELNASFGSFASKYGRATVSNTVTAAEPVDLVIVNHVLEHLADPVGTLRELGALLRPTGQLYIDVPDVEAYTTILDLHIAHIFHFSTRTLQRLVELAGFAVERVEKHRPPHHPPSVRLVATFRGAPQPAVDSTAASEAAAWAAVRRSGRALQALRLRLRQVPAARAAYRLAQRLRGGSPKP